jgi:uncharacterized membrane protein
MIPWDKLHGAMTHFPIALLLFSTACDFASVILKKLPFCRELRLVSKPLRSSCCRPGFFGSSDFWHCP